METNKLIETLIDKTKDFKLRWMQLENGIQTCKIERSYSITFDYDKNHITLQHPYSDEVHSFNISNQESKELNQAIAFGTEVNQKIFIDGFIKEIERL
jgi:hypothetical protein